MRCPIVTETRSRRRGFHRWLLLLLIVGNVLATMAVSPIKPHVQLAAEAVAGPILLPVLGEFYLTNTIIAALFVDLLLIIMALVVRAALRRNEGSLGALPGVAGVVETVLEALYNLVQSTAGKWTKRILPIMATIVLVVLLANWTELLPGVDSIGWLHDTHGKIEGFPARELFRIGDLKVSAIVKEGPKEGTESQAASTEHTAEYNVVPFVRVASTDLNFTLALAIVAVVSVQIIGLSAGGPRYLTKFFNFGGAVRMWAREKLGPFEVIMPLLDIFVGLLEFVAEVARIISFGFRLFGNIFAGSILLFILGALVPVFVQSGMLLFEMFVGVIQALVFGMLTMVFMTMATQIHGGDHASAH